MHTTIADSFTEYYKKVQDRYFEVMRGVQAKQVEAIKNDPEEKSSENSDVVNISDKAKMASSLAFEPVKTVTAKDGTIFTIEAATADEEGQYAAVRVTWYDPSGKLVTEVLRENAVISRNEEGHWSVGYPQSGATLTGTSGDDIIILTPNRHAVNTVNAGDGDNTILDFSSGHSIIVSGSGNDTIIGYGGGTYNVDSGDGNDTIILKGDYARINAGNGDDVIDVTGAVAVDIEGGTGNDDIKVNSDVLYRSNIDGGDGDDVISIQGALVESKVDGGAGNDSIRHTAVSGTSANSDVNISLPGVIAHSTITGGDGDDTVTTNSMLWASRIEGGAGDDSIAVNHTATAGSIIDGGAGNDTISVTALGGSSVTGGDGDDNITVVNTSMRGNINGGAGNDSIYVRTSMNSTITGGDGNDVITADHIGGIFKPVGQHWVQTGSYIDAGNGNNTIAVQSAYGSTIRSGDGDDSITVDNSHGTVISAGAGNDSIRVNEASFSSIQGNDGNDSITVQSANHTVILGGSANDTSNSGIVSNSIISGGDGDARIEVKEADASILSGDTSEPEQKEAPGVMPPHFNPIRDRLLYELSEFEQELDELSRQDVRNPRVRARKNELDAMKNEVHQALSVYQRVPETGEERHNSQQNLVRGYGLRPRQYRNFTTTV